MFAYFKLLGYKSIKSYIFKGVIEHEIPRFTLTSILYIETFKIALYYVGIYKKQLGHTVKYVVHLIRLDFSVILLFLLHRCYKIIILLHIYNYVTCLG
jgi:hypothetical protein